MTKHTTHPKSILDNHSGYLSVFKESKCVEPLDPKNYVEPFDHSESVYFSFKNKVHSEEITSWESVL
jgi:hypothetical protein